MDKENQAFCAGALVGILITCVILFISWIIKWNVENTGYENKLIIKYHNPTQEYDRDMVLKMVNDTQVWTNFVEKSIKMDKYWIEYRMTNPIK